jgi:hypothetical protein
VILSHPINIFQKFVAYYDKFINLISVKRFLTTSSKSFAAYGAY